MSIEDNFEDWMEENEDFWDEQLENLGKERSNEIANTLKQGAQQHEQTF